MLDRLPTRISIEKRDVNVQSNLCPLCRKIEETTQHLLIQCEVAQNVWDNCDKWLGIPFIRHKDVVNQYRNFFVIGLSRKANLVQKGIWVTIVSKIWKHRNKIVFHNGVVDDVVILTMAQMKAWSWAEFRS